MRTSITITEKIFKEIASGKRTKLKVMPSQEPELGLLKLYDYSDDYNHIDVYVESKKTRFGKVEFKFKVLAVYAL